MVRKSALMARHLAVFLSLCALALPARAIETKPQQMMIAVTDQSAAGMAVFEVLKDAYAAIGIQLTAMELPPQRALLESDAGRVDGEMVRGQAIEAESTHLRRVDVPIIAIGIGAILSKDTPARTPSEVAKLPAVGILRGVKGMENMTSGWPQVNKLANYPAAMQMLSIGRISAIIGPTVQLLAALEASGLEKNKFVTVEITQSTLYHYVHESKAQLIPELTSELRRLKGKEATVVDGVRKHAP